MRSYISLSKRLSILVCFLMIHVAARLQTASSVFRNDSINSRQLSKLFVNALNSMRNENNLYHVEREDGVQLAADDHAAYMKRHEKTGHEQTEKTKSSPEKRIAFFNSKCRSAAEIVLFFPIRKKSSKGTVNKKYAEVAGGILNEAGKNPEDLAKLLNAEADSYGFAVEPAGDSALYVVIILARNPNITLKEKVVSGEFGVQPYEKKTCDCITENTYFRKEDDLTLMIDGDSLFIKSERLPLLKKNFNAPKDAFYVDIVYRYQFPCGKENQLDESEIYDGTMMKPVKWTDLFARNLAKDGKNFYAFYGVVPSKAAGQLINYNQAYVKNGRVCLYKYGSMPPNANLQMVPLRPKWIYDENLKLKADTFGGKIKIPFPFAVNETTLKADHLKRLEKKLKVYLPYITKATIRTYSSIEGDEKSNLELQRKRADVIKSFMKRLSKKDVPVDVESKENWEYFLSETKDLWIRGRDTVNRDTIRAAVNLRSMRELFKPVLDKSREATLEIELDARVDDKSDPDLIFAGFQRKIMLGDSARANAFQNKLLQHFFDKKITGAEILSFNLPYNKKFLKIWTNFLALKINDKEDLVSLHFTRDSVLKAARMDSTFSPLQFNFCLLALKYFAAHDTLVPLNELERKMNNSYSFATTKKDSVLVNHMFLNYNLVALYYYWDTYQFDKVDGPLANIKKYYPQAELTEEEAIELGLLFNYYTRWEWTQELLLPYMRSYSKNESTTFLYVQTAVLGPLCGEDEWMVYLRRAKKMNAARFNFWLDKRDFQLLRDDKIKKVFCEN